MCLGLGECGLYHLRDVYIELLGCEGQLVGKSYVDKPSDRGRYSTARGLDVDMGSIFSGAATGKQFLGGWAAADLGYHAKQAHLLLIVT